MRVMIADDQAMVRSALKLLLSQTTECEEIDECTDGADLLAAVEHSRPDLLLLDWELESLNASETLMRLKQRRPSMLVVALSSRPQAREAALMCGADEFVNKGDPPEQLLSIVEKHCGMRQIANHQ